MKRTEANWHGSISKNAKMQKIEHTYVGVILLEPTHVDEADDDLVSHQLFEEFGGDEETAEYEDVEAILARKRNGVGQDGRLRPLPRAIKA